MRARDCEAALALELDRPVHEASSPGEQQTTALFAQRQATVVRRAGGAHHRDHRRAAARGAAGRVTLRLKPRLTAGVDHRVDAGRSSPCGRPRCCSARTPRSARTSRPRPCRRTSPPASASPRSIRAVVGAVAERHGDRAVQRRAAGAHHRGDVQRVEHGSSSPRSPAGDNGGLRVQRGAARPLPAAVPRRGLRGPVVPGRHDGHRGPVIQVQPKKPQETSTRRWPATPAADRHGGRRRRLGGAGGRHRHGAGHPCRRRWTSQGTAGEPVDVRRAGRRRRRTGSRPSLAPSFLEGEITQQLAAGQARDDQPDQPGRVGRDDQRHGGRRRPARRSATSPSSPRSTASRR